MWYNNEACGGKMETVIASYSLHFDSTKKDSDLVCDHWKLLWLSASPQTTHTSEFTHTHPVEIFSLDRWEKV